MNLYKEALKKIEQYEVIVIFGHTSPDGDCYGAQAGLKQFIKENYKDKEVYIVGTGFKRAIGFFGEMDNIEDSVFHNALGIVVDVSDIERIEDQRVKLCKEVIKIDHHLKSEFNDPFFSLNIFDSKVSSASQMIGHFVLENGFKISKDVGERIFLGIVTDSGRFSYLNSSKGLFYVLDEIMKAEIDFQKIYDFLYEGDEVATRVRGYVSYFFEKSKNNVAYCIMKKEAIAELNTDYNAAA